MLRAIKRFMYGTNVHIIEFGSIHNLFIQYGHYVRKEAV